MTPAKVNRIEITLSDDKLASLDAARGLVPRAAFIKHWTEVGINTALALSSSETPKPLTVDDVSAELGKRVSSRNVMPRGSASPSLERFSKAQRKGKG